MRGGLQPLRDGDPRVVGGYLLEARIGEGGMGSVFLTRSRGNRPLALKVIRAEHAQDDSFRERFVREVEAASRVAGYHLLPVLDYDLHGQEPWMATEFKPGLSLQDLLNQHGALPPDAVLQLVGCAALALAAVHAAGFVHRDVKPSNLLITGDGPWVIDFGIARAAEATQLTVTGGVIGTPQFMSPEHALGRELTAASDVFALALVAAVAATSRHPYGEAPGLGIAALIASTATRPPDLDGYPPVVGRILQVALTAVPEDRPTAEEFARLCSQECGRPVRDLVSWLPNEVSSDLATAAAEAASWLSAPAPTPTQVDWPPRDERAGGAGRVVPLGVFGPPPSVDAPSPGTASSAVQPVRRLRALTAVASGALAVLALAALATWAIQRPDSQGRPDGSGHSPTMPLPTKQSPSASASPEAPGGYKLIFAERPFTLAPPPKPEQWNIIDFDLPQTTLFERGSLQGPGELIYGTDGISGSIFSVVGKRTTVCDRAEETAMIPHPLPAAELRNGRILKTGLLLCSITSNDNIAEVLITEVVPGPQLPTYKGHITLWKRPL
ncbi:serine/threonine-protein kinase [Streptomyces sp. H27-C3]|uniref:serine/threonine protein kinase n=1 Tax=Streptomyces sp. H27-C3 TaxID=3046305 RepID=UPI0024BA813D|nr:serine/threonine-protein kinase [Streptomyces sp. H27-C3]MDJ0464268.1 serine/threonine-protein kinase [Streptomyces sp. H27-C3]